MSTENLQSTAPKAATFNFSYYVIWGLASLGLNMINGVFTALLPIFYQDYLGLAAKWMSLAALIYGIWNAINDPLFGYITDNTHSRLGRRIPYMRYTAPFLALTFILIWFAPAEASEQTLFWWMLISMFLFDTCFTIVGLVYVALLPELSESDSERTKLQISYSIFSMIGMLIGLIVPELFRPKAGGATTFLPLQMSMIVLGITGALLIIATTFKVKERLEFSLVDKPLPLGQAISLTFKSKAFLLAMGATFMSMLVNGLVFGAIYYLADYVLQISGTIVLLYAFIPFMIGVPLTELLRRRFGVVGAMQVMQIIAGVGFCLITVVPNSLILPCLALGGLGTGGVLTMSYVLFAQVADEDEVKTGVRREGAFFGINALFTKPALSLSIALISLILEATHFVTREAHGGIFLNQPSSAILGIKVLIGLIPGIAMLLGALILKFYPLRGKYLEEIQAKVLQMHQEKAQKLAELQKEQIPSA